MRLNDISKNKYFFKYSIYLFLFSGRPISKFRVNKAESQSERSFHQIGVFLDSLMREAFWLAIKKAERMPKNLSTRPLVSCNLIWISFSPSATLFVGGRLGFQLLGLNASLNLLSKLLLSTTTVGKLPPTVMENVFQTVEQFGKRFP